MPTLINQPPSTTVDDADPLDGAMRVRTEWRNFFQSAYAICNALTQSGTTAQRPVKLLWIGRVYFDVTLGYPVWVQAVTPAVVWCDATGAPA